MRARFARPREMGQRAVKQEVRAVTALLLCSLLLLAVPAVRAQEEVAPAPVVPAPGTLLPAPVVPAPVVPTPADPAQPAPVQPAPPQPVPVPTTVQRFVKRLAPGVTLIQEITPAGLPGGPMAVNALKIERGAPGVRIEAALAQGRVWGSDATLGRETVSSMVRRNGALAGINAAFFPFAGNPIGLHVGGGELVTEPNARTVMALMTDNRTRFDTFSFTGRARIEGGEPLTIHGMNRRPGKGNELLLYTPRFFTATLPAPGRYEVAIATEYTSFQAGKSYSGTVTAVREGGGLPLPGGTLILSGGGAAASLLRSVTVGSRVEIRMDVVSRDGVAANVAMIREAVAGGPRLLTAGRVAINGIEEGFATDFVSGRHPRTAAATTAEGDLLLVAVDGRLPSLSRGVSLAELATILLNLGARDAVNLDGGGSTALSVRGAVVNAPSGGAERAVASALLIYAPEGGPYPAPLALTGPAGPVTVGQSYAVSLTDASGQARATDPGTIWGTAGGVGLVTQEGVFHALRPGKGTIQAIAGTEVVTTPVTVLPVTVGAKASAAARVPAAVQYGNNRLP